MLPRGFQHSPNCRIHALKANALLSGSEGGRGFGSVFHQLFMDGDIDIRIPATALRVMVAHGSFTPTGTDSLTKAGAEALQRLSDVLLQECERRFGAWLHEMLAKRDEAA